MRPVFMDRGAGHVAYKLVVFLLILIPIAVTDTLIIIATILEPSVKRTVKTALINITEGLGTRLVVLLLNYSLQHAY